MKKGGIVLLVSLTTVALCFTALAADGIVVRRAVVVGVSDYLYVNSLQFCDSDAQVFRSELLKDDRWTAGNINLLVNSGATKANVQAAVASMVSAADSDDICIFFFSGHGFASSDLSPYDEADNMDEYLVPHDGDDDLSLIRDDELANWLSGAPCTVIVFLDACFSGGQAKGITMAADQKRRIKTINLGGPVPARGDGFAKDMAGRPGAKDLNSLSNMVVLSACDDDQACVEDGILAHGVFSFYLVEAMNSYLANTDSDGDISAEEAYHYLRPHSSAVWMYEDPSDPWFPQRQDAQLVDNRPGEAEFFHAPPAGPNAVIASWNMNAFPFGWTEGPSSNPWGWGTPTGGNGDAGDPDPTGGYTGTKVFGYNLTGGYNNEISEYFFKSSSVDCSDYSRVHARFRRWLGVEGWGYDHAIFQVSNNGSTWTDVWTNFENSISDREWVLCEYDISSVAAEQSTVYLRWVMGPTDTSYTFCGWNIDDVELRSDAGVTSLSISGAKFNDLNLNGIWNSGEPGLPGWTIFLDLDESGGLNGDEPWTLTNAVGQYLFEDLEPGTYTVAEVLQDGWVQTFPVIGFHQVTVSDGLPAGNINFGNAIPVPPSISGAKFEDANENGVWDDDEPALPGWTIFLDLNKNGVPDQFDETLVFSSGNVPRVIPSSTTITSTLEASTVFKQIQDINVTLNITHGWDSDLDVYLVSPEGTSVQLFTDVGGSGKNFDNTTLDDEAATPITSGTAPFIGVYSPEGWLADFDGENVNGTWTLEITDDTAGYDGALNSWSITMAFAGDEPSTQTNAQGEYIFEDLETGAYTVAEVLEEGWAQTFPEEGFHQVAVGVGWPAKNVNFGNAVLHTGAISGVKFADANENGVWDDGEPGLPGWTIFLDHNGSGVPDEFEGTLVFDSEDTPMEIPSSNTVTSTLEASTLLTQIQDINVTVDIAHTWDTDLDVYLISPENTRVELFTDVGSSGDNFENTTLDDEAATPITSGTAPFSGSYSPEGLLADFDGEDPNGTWTLEVTDDSAGDDGTLNSWSIALAFTDDEPFTQTNEEGEYIFERLDPGTYTVAELLEQDYWEQTFPAAPGTHTAPVTIANTTADINFGNRFLLDVTGDCAVNILDMIAIRNHLGEAVVSDDNDIYDVTGDGKIDVLDMIAIRNHLGESCVPSP